MIRASHRTGGETARSENSSRTPIPALS
jgi:hypothetical protein